MIRSDVQRAARVAFDDEEWVASPELGVDRKLLERDGGEVARATSIVRYRAGSHFPAHQHDLGEEILVLAGTFSDEHGDYPAGTYVRNPAASRHRPFSVDGCTIFVKLRQILPGDTAHVVARPDRAPWPAPKLLHAFGAERVEVIDIHPGRAYALAPYSELFVLGGSLQAADATTGTAAACPPWTWLRTAGAPLTLSSTTPATCWVKQGHLTGAPASRHQDARSKPYTRPSMPPK